jgi:hypothetical protein
MRNIPGLIWLRLAVLYFILGVGLGIYMAASGDHLLVPVHAHLNLLGWVSLALIGLIYRQFPEIAANTLATIQFWLHNVALPVAMLALVGVLLGNPALEPVAGFGASVIGVSVVLFAANLFRISRP